MYAEKSTKNIGSIKSRKKVLMIGKIFFRETDTAINKFGTKNIVISIFLVPNLFLVLWKSITPDEVNKNRKV